MADLARLRLVLEAENKKLLSTLEASNRELRKFQRNTTTTMNAIKGVFATALGGLSVGVVLRSLKETVDLADDMGKLSQATGIQVEELSKLTFAAERNQLSQDKLVLGLKFMTLNMLDLAKGSDSAKKAFEAIGITAEDLKDKTPDQALKIIADRFAGAEDGAKKTEAAIKIFNKSGQFMIPLLNQGSKGLNDLGIEAEKLGVVITKDASDAASQFNDNISRMNSAVLGLKISIGNELLPGLTAMTQAILDARDAGTGLLGVILQLGGINQLNQLRGRMDELLRRRRELQDALASPAGIVPANNFLGFTTQSKTRLQNELDEIEAQIAGMNEQMLELERRMTVPTPTPPPKRDLPGGETDDEKKERERRERFIEANRSMLEKAKADVDEFNKYFQAGYLSEDAFVEGIERATKGLKGFLDNSDLEKALADRNDAQLAALADYLRTQQEMEQEAYERRKELILANIADEQERARLLAALDKKRADDLADQDESVRQARQAALDMGFAFSSAFEDAILKGERFSNVLQGVYQDIARIALRVAITQPLGEALGGGLKGVLPWGGGKASGGPISAGRAYLVGERGPEVIVPRSAATVIPNHALAGTGQVIVQNIDQRSGGAPVQTTQGMENGQIVIRNYIRDEVASAISSGGLDKPMRSSFGASRRLTPR